MKKANYRESVPEAIGSEIVMAVQQIDQDIQQRVKTLIPNTGLYELQEKVALCLQVERNDWRAKIQSVFRQLDNEHKKSQKVKNALLEIILSHYPAEKYQSTFEEELEIKDLINHLKEMILDLKNFNLKLVQDLNSFIKSKDSNPTMANKDEENNLCPLKTMGSEKQLIPDRNMLEYGENQKTACCNLKDWCQSKSLVNTDCTDESQCIAEQQHKESTINKETEQGIHIEKPVTVDLGHKCLLSDQGSMNSKCKIQCTVPNLKTNLVKHYMSNNGIRMKDQLLKSSNKGYAIGGKGRMNSQKKEILQCHQVNGYDIKTDHKNQIFQERFFCKLVAKGPIKHTFSGNKN